jgi:hypothetical protein
MIKITEFFGPSWASTADVSASEVAKVIAVKKHLRMDATIPFRSPDVNILATRQQLEFCYKQNVPQTAPLPFPRCPDSWNTQAIPTLNARFTISKVAPFRLAAFTGRGWR